MNTVFLLMAAHEGKAVLELTEVAEKYLDLKDKAFLYRKTQNGELPFPAFKLINSQKAPWMVAIDDLAAYIDKQREKAKKDLTLQKEI